MQSLFRRSAKRRDQDPRRVSVLKHVAYGVFSLSVVILVGVSFWYVSRLPAFTISTIEVRGGETIAHDEVRALVDEMLTGSYLLVVPYRHVYFYPEDRIIDRMMRVPRIKSVTLERVGTTLEVSFEEYTPFALWCISPEERETCYFMSDDGFAFASAPLLRGETLVRHYIEGRQSLEEGQVLETRTIETTEKFRELLLERFGWSATDITHAKSSDIVYHLSGGGDLLTASGIAVEDTFENLVTILESEEFKHLQPGNFRYIDLRFGQKVYVNESFETGTSTDATVSTTTSESIASSTDEE